MANVALGMPLEEHAVSPEAITDGKSTGYTHGRGFTAIRWPGPITVDLQRDHLLACIRFLLWDGRGQAGPRDQRIYKYRLLVSSDRVLWKVVHDNFDGGGNGWQEFLFEPPITVRYVRVYALWNSANEFFHVVELEAHDAQPPSLGDSPALQRVVSDTPLRVENGDALPITASVERIVSGIERLVNENSVLNPKPFQELTARLRGEVQDLAAIERSMDAIRREIVGPVQRELALSSKVGKIGLWLGLAGTILALLTLAKDLVIGLL